MGVRLVAAVMFVGATLLGARVVGTEVGTELGHVVAGGNVAINVEPWGVRPCWNYHLHRCPKRHCGYYKGHPTCSPW